MTKTDNLFVLVIGYWSLRFICDLMLVIWCLLIGASPLVLLSS